MIEEPQPKTTRNIIIALVVLAVLAGFGAIGYVSGTGWFGYRQILYGTGEVYLLNLGDEDLEASVDGREPVVVKANDAKITDLIGGTSEIVVRDMDGEVVDRYSITAKNSHALLKLSDQGCLVASDISSFYRKGGDGEIKFVEFLEEDDHVYIPGSKNVIWPRKQFPQRLSGSDGTGIWTEWVACQLLEEKDYLRAYLRVRLLDRMGANEGSRGSEPPSRKTPLRPK